MPLGHLTHTNTQAIEFQEFGRLLKRIRARLGQASNEEKELLKTKLQRAVNEAFSGESEALDMNALVDEMLETFNKARERKPNPLAPGGHK